MLAKAAPADIFPVNLASDDECSSIRDSLLAAHPDLEELRKDGGWRAKRFLTIFMISLGVLGTSVLTLLLPLCASRLWLLFTVRAVTGFCESVTFPAMNVLFTEWIPCEERSFLVAFATGGAYVGTIIAFPISGYIIGLKEDSDGTSTTWPWVFYFFGICGLIWTALWQLLGSSRPSEPSCYPISEKEQQYLDLTVKADGNVIGERTVVTKSPHPPWRNFLTHPAAWAIYINHFAYNYGYYTLLTYLPKYMDEELGFSLKDSGIVAVIPYMLQWIFAIGSGLCADTIVKAYSVRTVRLLAQSISFMVGTAALAGTGWIRSTPLAMACLSFAVASSGVSVAGYSTNYVDVSPHYAGQLYSVGNVIANLAGIISPIIAGYILGDSPADDDRPPGLYTPAMPPFSDDSSGSGSYDAPASHWRN
eukprot:gene15355-23477_t